MFFSPLSCYFLSDSNSLLITLFQNTLNLCSSISVRDHTSYTYRTMNKIIIFESLCFREET